MLLTQIIRPAGASATSLKSVRIVSCVATKAAVCYTTSASPARPAKVARTSQPFFSSGISQQTSPILSLVRKASTATTSASGPSEPAPSASKALTWNRFLELRRTRRKISVVASSVSAVATTFVGLRVFISGGYDSALSATLGLDPLLTAGLSTFALLALGWLIGPFFGNAAFNMRYSSIRKDIENKEREFYSRIKRHRVDPTSSSMANPVPDYYGEKIGSVADYRRWLKDQRAFNLKRGAYQGNK